MVKSSDLHIRAGRYNTACGIAYYLLTDGQGTALSRTIPGPKGKKRIQNDEIKGLCHNCLQALVNLDSHPKDYQLIVKIVQRALKTGGSTNLDRRNLAMDITAAHLNGCKLDLVELLNAKDSDFWHDVLGIRQHLNRLTGKLKNCFDPRCSV